MDRLSSLNRMLVVLLLLLVPATSRAAELRKLHVLLVFDTVSDLDTQLVKDEMRLTSLLRHHIPKSRMQITVLKGDRATPANIRAYYRSLKVTPQEGMFFFYGGHGAIDPKKGHYLALQFNKTPMLRDDLRFLMKSKKAGLTVIVTDCCSNLVRLRAMPREVFPAPRDIMSPVFKHLFFLNRGLVDINATDKGDVSWGDTVTGGLFTFTLTGALSTPLTRLDRNRDGKLTWKEFFPQMRNHTEKYFKGWASKMRSGGEKISSRTQKPRAFQLTDNFAGDKVEKPKPQTNGKTVQSHLAINIQNNSKEKLTYRYRWSDEKAFHTRAVAAGKESLHTRKLASKFAKAPTLVVRLPGYPEGRLKGRIHRSKDRPTSADAKNFEFNPRSTKRGDNGLGGTEEIITPPTIEEDE